MTYVNKSDWSNLSNLCNGLEPLILTTQIPWQAHHDHTMVLGNGYNGHVFLKIMCHREAEIYHLGDATGLVPPIFLKDFKREAVAYKPKLVNVSYIVSIVMRRFQSQLIEREIPEVMPIDNEKLARSVMRFLCEGAGILQKWVVMEQLRIKTLIDHYDFTNLKLVYPMLLSKETWENDIKNAYFNTNIVPLAVPDKDVFQWVLDTVNNF